MVQRRNRAGFLLEEIGKLARAKLDRDITVQPCVAGLHTSPIPPLANAGNDLIRPDIARAGDAVQNAG